MSKSNAYKISLTQGDGIGPEVTSAARKVLAAAGIEIEWELVDAGLGAIEKYNKNKSCDYFIACREKISDA
jgi:isocitrate/isopropylmalate dehydrogenase